MKKSIYFALLALPILAFGKDVLPHCEGEAKDNWVQERRKGMASDPLFLYGIAEFGPMLSCKGEFKDTEYGFSGTISFSFKNSGKMTLEILPPESSIVTLESDKGFSDETGAIKALKVTTTNKNFRVEWSSPEIQKSRDKEEKSFWNPDSGLNTRAFLVYKDKKLVSMGYSYAR